MADILTTSSINSLISNYQSNESVKVISPLKTRKDRYSSQSSSYDTLITKLNALKTELTAFNKTGTEGVFAYKQASSSNTNFVSASASSTTLPGSFEMRVNQLAKKDIALSGKFTSTDANAISGLQKFKIISGDGEGGEFVSNIEVEFTGTETNKSAIEKIQTAINTDKAVVKGDYKTGTDAYSGGPSTFKINLNGTETIITLDGSSATYSELMDSIVSSVNTNVDGVTAEKVADPLDSTKFRLSFTVDDNSKYISVSSDTGFNLVTDLNIGVTKEKGASGIVTASSFSPTSGNTQLSFSARESGLDYRIKEISDENTYTALTAFNMNFGTSRPVFNQTNDTPGFTYADITTDGNQLNSKLIFNGLELQRNSNTITDIADGLTFNLKSIMAGSDTNVNISVANDMSTMRGKVDSFISKFNDLYTYLKTNSTYSSGNRGSLYGDASAQTLTSFLSSTAFSTVSGLSVNSLNSIGISFNSSTGLTLSDVTKLESKINAAPDQVASLFNSTEGISQKLLTNINPYIGSQGFLTKQKTSMTNNITGINNRIKSAEARINKSSANLRNRYEQLQAQLASLLSIQSYLSY